MPKKPKTVAKDLKDIPDMDAQRLAAKKQTRQRAASVRRTRIKPRSKKMTKLMKYYNQRKALFIAENPLCVACEHPNNRRTQDIHHLRGVTNTLRLDERFWLPLCRSHHCFVTDEPAHARTFGLLCEAGDWDKAPDDSTTARLRELMKELTR